MDSRLRRNDVSSCVILDLIWDLFTGHILLGLLQMHSHSRGSDTLGIMRPIPMREIKSFVKRERALTNHQEKLFAEMWSQVRIALTENILDFNACFHREAPTVCEIGFGHGDTLCSMAHANPEINYLGLEVHRPGIAEALENIKNLNLKNVRIIQDDAVKVMEKHIPDAVFSRIHIYFPDPWPKKRHHKRRLVNPKFVAVLVNKLKPGGMIHCATDWENYALQMMQVLSENSLLKNTMGEGQYADNETLNLRAHTKFERRGVKLGHKVFDMVFVK